MKFNKKFFGAKNEIRNYEGGQAFRMTPEFELYTAVVTSALADNFYEKGSDRLERIRELVGRVRPEFVAKLAVYAREKMYLRSVPLVLAVELAKVHRGDDLVARTVARVVQRADEITELLACYQNANQRQGAKKLNKLSKQVQKGLIAAFNRFDEYQFAKYNREAEVKLRDALFLVHPKPKDAGQQAIFDKIVAETLDVPFTWEVELSRLGQVAFETPKAKAEAVRAKWTELVDKGVLGYMALLRNLRNLVQAEVSVATLEKVAARLADAREVARSKQLPFRFLSAYRELREIQGMGVGILLEALEQAIQASVTNLPGFAETEKVLVACDASGSMQTQISRGKVQYYDIGFVLGMMLQAKCRQVITGMFAESWKLVSLPKVGILRNADELHRRVGEVGYATNGYLILKDLLARKVQVDKVMIFTDCQLYDSTGGANTLGGLWNQYKAKFPSAKLYVFDLAGYGQSPIRLEQKDVFLMAGWSDKVFEVLAAVERGGNALGEIDKVTL